MDIQKVNEKLGFFGGGILEPQPEEPAVLEGGTALAPHEAELEGNPYADPELASVAKNLKGDKAEASPKKPPKPTVKLPPVKGYKLDSLGLGEEGDKILKKSMDTGYGSDGRLGTGYKNP